MPVDGQLVSSIHGVTDGNAFLLCELWRALAETGSVAISDGTVRLTRPLHEVATPDSVREVVGQRVARLEPAARDLLALAAVAGPEFELAMLVLAAAGDTDVTAALDSAAASGLIEEVPARTIRYRFAHELVRRAIHDRLSSLARAELHLRIG